MYNPKPYKGNRGVWFFLYVLLYKYTYETSVEATNTNNAW